MRTGRQIIELWQVIVRQEEHSFIFNIILYPSLSLYLAFTLFFIPVCMEYIYYIYIYVNTSIQFVCLYLSGILLSNEIESKKDEISVNKERRIIIMSSYWQHARAKSMFSLTSRHYFSFDQLFWSSNYD